MSPSLWWDDRRLLHDAEKSFASHEGLQAFLYLTTGNELGHMLAFRVFEKHRDEAMAAFKLSVALHPDSATAHDTLGQAYEDGGQLDLARECFEIAVRKGTETSNSYLPEIKARLDRVSKPKAK